MLARMTTQAGIVPPVFLSYYVCGYGSPTYMVYAEPSSSVHFM